MEIETYRDLSKYREYMTNEFCLCCAYFQETKGHFGVCQDRKDKTPYDGSKKGTGSANCWRLKSCYQANNIEFDLPVIPGLIRQRLVVRPKKLMRQWIKRPRIIKPKRSPKTPKPKKPDLKRRNIRTAKRCVDCGVVFLDNPDRLDHDRCKSHAIRVRQEQKARVIQDALRENSPVISSLNAPVVYGSWRRVELYVYVENDDHPLL